MTIRELAEGNMCILDIDIEVRDYNDGGHFIHEYRFGGGAQYYPGDHARFDQRWNEELKCTDKAELHIDVDSTEINTHDFRSGKDYYQLCLNHIPKRFQPLLDEEVKSWNLESAYRGLSTYYTGAKRLYVIIDSSARRPIAKPVEEKEKKSIYDGWENLEGQMSLFDMVRDE